MYTTRRYLKANLVLMRYLEALEAEAAPLEIINELKSRLALLDERYEREAQATQLERAVRIEAALAQYEARPE